MSGISPGVPVQRDMARTVCSQTQTFRSLSQVAKEVAEHTGNVWTNIISLRREDAARLGYDNAYAWRNLLRSQAMTFAKNMKIPLSDLRWYAAYHDESYHPHVHMVVYSVGKEPYLSKDGIAAIKSSLARQIFKHDLMQVYIEQTNQRNALVRKEAHYRENGSAS